MKSKYIDCIIFFIFGATVLSRVSAYLSMDVLGVPIYMPEIIVMFFVPFLWARYLRPVYMAVKSQIVYLYFAALLILIFIVYSLYVNSDGLIHVLGTARGYMYIIVIALICKNIDVFNLRMIFWASMGSVVSTFIDVVFVHDVRYLESVFYVNLTAVFIVVIILLVRNKYSMFGLVFLMVISLGFATVLRRVFVVLVLGILFAMVVNYFSGKRSDKAKVIIVTFVLYVFGEYIAKYIIRISEINSYIYNRIIVKTIQSTVSGGSIGDVRRYEWIIEIPHYFYEYIVWPNGFITKDTKVSGTGMYMDIPLWEIIYTFGGVLSAIMIISIIVAIVSYVKRIIICRKDKICYVVPLTVVLFMCFLFFDGAFLLWPYTTVYTGIFLGLIFNKNVEIVYS